MGGTAGNLAFNPTAKIKMGIEVGHCAGQGKRCDYVD